MNKFSQKFKIAWHDKSLRRRILIMLGLLVAFRLLATIPIPGVDAGQLKKFLDNNQFFGILNIFSGGGLSTLSLIMLGVGPYITSSIIMQLLTMMVPRLKTLYSEEGEAGRRKFAQYSRLVTIPLALIQGLGLLILLKKQGILGALSPFALGVSLATVVAGSILLMWIGEIMTEYGISNGVSIIIFAGIVSALPRHIAELQFADISQIPYYVLFAIVGLIMIAAVVMVTEAERPVPVTYARQVRGTGGSGGGVQTYLPLRINQAGVIPIIFALSILLIPQLLGSLLTVSHNAIILSISHALTSFSQTTWLYAIIYFVLVFVFTYFYTAVTFDPHAMAENLQKTGAFIPGIRPGASTEEHLARVVSRITFVGALFLGLIAVLPLAMRALTGITSIALGGTALLIVVSVILDLIKRVDAQISMHEY